jgi:hypothetical protein
VPSNGDRSVHFCALLIGLSFNSNFFFIQRFSIHSSTPPPPSLNSIWGFSWKMGPIHFQPA